MFTYACVITAFVIYRLSTKDSRAFSRLIFLSFLFYKASFLLISQFSYLMSTPLLLLIYTVIQAAIIRKAKVSCKSQFAILALIFISLSYNMLTISQYALVTYDFYGLYHYIIKPIEIIELLLLSWNVKYVADYRRLHRDTYANIIDRLFCFCGWLPNRSLL